MERDKELTKEEIKQYIYGLLKDAWKNSYNASSCLNKLPKRSDEDYDREIVWFVMKFKRAIRVKSKIIYAFHTEELIEYYYHHQIHYDFNNI